MNPTNLKIHQVFHFKTRRPHHITTNCVCTSSLVNRTPSLLGRSVKAGSWRGRELRGVFAEDPSREAACHSTWSWGPPWLSREHFQDGVAAGSPVLQPTPAEANHGVYLAVTVTPSLSCPRSIQEDQRCPGGSCHTQGTHSSHQQGNTSTKFPCQFIRPTATLERCNSASSYLMTFHREEEGKITRDQKRHSLQHTM